MLCYVILCYIVLHYVTSCYIMLCYVILCYIMLYYVILCYIMLYYVILCYIMLYYVILCYIMLYYVILCYIMLYQMTSYQIISYHNIVLYYMMSYHIISCCIRFHIISIISKHLLLYYSTYLYSIANIGFKSQQTSLEQHPSNIIAVHLAWSHIMPALTWSFQGTWPYGWLSFKIMDDWTLNDDQMDK